MAVNPETKNTVMRLWLLLNRTHDTLSLSQDSIFGEYGITTEQFSVLACLKSRGGFLRPVDLAKILERKPNSMSMLVDRMVKAGLVKRRRDKKDRRAVVVSLTSKGETIVGPATAAGWEFIQQILLPLSDSDRQTLASMLEIVKAQALGYLSPEVDVAEITKNSFTQDPNLYKRMIKNILPSGSEAQRRGGKKRL